MVITPRATAGFRGEIVLKKNLVPAKPSHIATTYAPDIIIVVIAGSFESLYFSSVCVK